MVHADFPDVATQFKVYARVLDEAGSKPVQFRTLDVGGDKTLPYWHGIDEGNPALGWRAIRVSLDHPAMLRRQLRALIRAAARRELRVMFPMIAELAELEQARELLERELKRVKGRGEPAPERVLVGAMLEVPGLLFQLPALLARVDFLSVGSNDLAQFLFASDRTNPRLAERYDELSPAMLAVLKTVAEQCAAAGVPVGVCGEMAGRPVDAMALVGLGYRSLSMATPSIGPVKEMILSLNAGRLGQYLSALIDPAEHSMREKLRDFARDHGVAV